MLGPAPRFLLLAGLLLCGASPCAVAEAAGYEGAASPEDLPLPAVPEQTAADTVVDAKPAPATIDDAQTTTEPPAVQTKDADAPPVPANPFVGLWQSQRPAPPMWLDIKPNGQAYRCYVETSGEGDTDVYASNGRLETDRVAWKILWGKERVTVSGESLVLKGKSGGVFYAKTKEPLPAACDGTDQAGTVERRTRSFNR